MALTGPFIQTSKGEGYVNKDTEDFSVEKLAVDISGPPYVILDNAPGIWLRILRTDIRPIQPMPPTLPAARISTSGVLVQPEQEK